MDERLEQFRTEAAKLGPAKAGRKFTKELMAIGAEHARARRDEGGSWQCIADELGVGVPTVRRWCERRVESAGFKSVAVIDDRREGKFVASIGALRVEGLDFEALVALAKALS